MFLVTYLHLSNNILVTLGNFSQCFIMHILKNFYVKLCVTEEAGGIQLSHCSCLVSNLRRPAGPGWHKQQLVSTEPPEGEPPHHSWGDTRIVNKYG